MYLKTKRVLEEMDNFAIQKFLKIFRKNASTLDLTCTRRLNETLANDVVKLTTL